MKAQTEKLGMEFYEILERHGKEGKGYQVDFLLKACKEAGLKFVYNEKEWPHQERIEEIE